MQAIDKKEVVEEERAEVEVEGIVEEADEESFANPVIIFWLHAMKWKLWQKNWLITSKVAGKSQEERRKEASA